MQHDNSLEFEALINSWGHAFNVHKTGKGQTCSLRDLKLNKIFSRPSAASNECEGERRKKKRKRGEDHGGHPEGDHMVGHPSGDHPGHHPGTPSGDHARIPSGDHLFVQRLLVENASALHAFITNEVWEMPCKKNVCKDIRADSRAISREWLKIILQAFSQPTEPTYLIQSRDDWRSSLELLIKAIQIEGSEDELLRRTQEAREKGEKKAAQEAEGRVRNLTEPEISLSQIVTNCTAILDYEVFKIPDYNCFPLLKAISDYLRRKSANAQGVVGGQSSLPSTTTTNSATTPPLSDGATPTSDDLTPALRRLTKIIVATSTRYNDQLEELSRSLSADYLVSDFQVFLAQDLFDSWRASGVIGTACAEKLIQFLSSSKVSNEVFLRTLKQLALSGHAPSLARSTPSVMEYLKHMAEMRDDLTGSGGANYEDRYNATLLLMELFPRYAWETMGVMISNLKSPDHFKSFIITAWSLHDIPRLLSLIPETYDLLCEDESCMILMTVKAAEASKQEILSIIQYAEGLLLNTGGDHPSAGDHQRPSSHSTPLSISLSWIALILALIVGSQVKVKTEFLLGVSEILHGQDVYIIRHLIRYWSLAVSRHYNEQNRDSEIQLTIIKPGPKISYQPEGVEKLQSIVTQCCQKWRKEAPRAVNALIDRMELEKITVFQKVQLPKHTPYTGGVDGVTAAEKKLEFSLKGNDHHDTTTSSSEFSTALEKFKEFFDNHEITPLDDDLILTALEGFKKIFSTWNYLIHRPAEATAASAAAASADPARSVEFFEKYVDVMVSAVDHGVLKIIKALENFGLKMQDLGFAESIYESIDQWTKLQRFLVISLRICFEIIFRPLDNRKSHLNYLWFDRQLSPLIERTNYLMRSSLWFYRDTHAPLPLKLGLAQQYAKFIEYAPKAFSKARLPSFPIEVLEEMIKREHRAIKESLQQRLTLELSDPYRFHSEIDYHRDVVAFIEDAIKT